MAEGVVISQPGQKEKGDMMAMQQPGMQPGMQPGAGFVPMNLPQVMVPAGLPPGLGYLAQMDEIKIHQQMELLEVIIGWEKNNRYTVCNKQDQQFMFAKEETDCMTRQCCGPSRPFTMNITDNQGMQLIQLHRPFRCRGSCMWCCYLQEMEIQSPPGCVVGQVKEVWTCWIPKYKVYDNQETCLFTIIGDCCYCKLCVDVTFRVFEGDGEDEEIGQIRKHFGGARELCGQANDFTLHLPPQMDIMRKTLMLGATFLIDFNFFENTK